MTRPSPPVQLIQTYWYQVDLPANDHDLMNTLVELLDGHPGVIRAQLAMEPIMRRILLLLLDQLDRDLGPPRDGELSDLRREAMQLLEEHPR